MHPVFTIKNSSSNNNDLKQKLSIPMDLFSKKTLHEVSEITNEDIVR